MPLDINELRQRILDGETYTREELREALAALRTERIVSATETTKKRAAKAPISDTDLDASLKSLGLDL